MNIDTEIFEECKRRHITRICHFTPSRNLAHIIAGKTGILSTSNLEASERGLFNPTDIKRLDGYKSHICCSIQYPNMWYLNRKIAEETLFRDWVVLLIKPDYLWLPGTLFCPVNAATGHGYHVNKGLSAFNKLFDDSVSTARRTIKRKVNHIASCPTDNQAEVLIPDCVRLQDIIGIAVKDEIQAKDEISRLKIQGLHLIAPIRVSPELFECGLLSDAISAGRQPREFLFGAEDETKR